MARPCKIELGHCPPPQFVGIALRHTLIYTVQLLGSEVSSSSVGKRSVGAGAGHANATKSDGKRWAVPTKSHRPIMRFYFDVANGRRRGDFKGVDCNGVAEARQHADKLAADFKRSGVLKNILGLHVDVTDESGFGIYKSPIKDD